jgi:hypothetical protein
LKAAEAPFIRGAPCAPSLNLGLIIYLFLQNSSHCRYISWDLWFFNPMFCKYSAHWETFLKIQSCNFVITRSLHHVHETNACRADHVCLSVRLHDSTREPLDGFGWNLVWTLCHWFLTNNRTF